MDKLHFENLGLEKAFFLESHNGFGFKVETVLEPGTIVFARLSDDAPANLETQLREKTGSKTIRHKDYLGHEYLTIHHSEWALIPRVFPAALEAGCSYVWANIPNLKPATRFVGELFSFEAHERATVEEFKKLSETFGDRENPWKFTFELLREPKAMRRLYNYRTEQGKMFCAELRARVGKPIDTSSRAALTALPWWYELPEVDQACREYTVLHHAEWSKREIPEKQEEEEEEKEEEEEPEAKRRKSESADDMVECLVCHERVANTLVLPCQHIVVCQLCSVNLAQTHWARECLYCQQHIEQVLQDEVASPPPEPLSTIKHVSSPFQCCVSFLVFGRHKKGGFEFCDQQGKSLDSRLAKKPKVVVLIVGATINMVGKMPYHPKISLLKIETCPEISL